MFKNSAGVLLVLGALVIVAVPSVCAQDRVSVAESPGASAVGVRSLLAWRDTGAVRSPLRLTNPGPWHLSSKGDAGAQPAANKKEGGKAMWITIAASAAVVSLAVMLAPGEAPIPMNPSRRSGNCTSFYRPGGLQTISGYTCSR